MKTCSWHIRALSLDPTSRGFGFAVLEGANCLIDWGVVQVRDNKNHRCLDRIGQLIDRYNPGVLVIEDTTRGSRRGPRVCQLLHSIEALAARSGRKAKAVAPKQVRLFFSQFGAAAKHEMAERVAKRFPELTPYLPPPRKPWNSEAEMMAVFDAIAFALTVIRS